MNDLAGRAAAEVAELHAFFEDWFTGRLPQHETAFARFADVTAPDFYLISPDGVMTEQTEVLAWVWGIHSARPTSRLWVDNVRLASQRRGFCIVTYEEWQQTPAERTVRLSTAVFVDAPAMPNGLQWLHVHETWLAAATK